MKDPKEYFDKIPYDFRIPNAKEWICEQILSAQKDAYNQAIEDSKLKIKYEPYHVEINTPTNNAGYTSRRNEELIDFLINYEDSILKLKIK